jgi:hypothetical protein
MRDARWAVKQLEKKGASGILPCAGPLHRRGDGNPAAVAAAPLANRIRPRSLEEFVRQEHILAPGKLLRRAIEADRLPSVILSGPPGTGKDNARANHRGDDAVENLSG